MPGNAITLYELNQKVREVIQSTFHGSIWVRAEIADLKENQNGHCYLDLVEKDESGKQVIARMRAIIWSYTYRMLKPFFESNTGRAFSKGIKILIKAKLEFQELYGFSLIIQDIDPAYTLGDIEQKRREVIKRLEDDGVIDMNKELELPLAAQNIAIISSPTAAGYEDFIHQLKNNSYGIVFYSRLFPSIMQGDHAAASLIKSLELIYENISLFDVVVIIRGGGASLDLLCFDDYLLANNIAQFPIPVITGIGHERDLTVADIVAHTNLKTPTAVAEFLISGAAGFLERINDYSLKMQLTVKKYLDQHHQKFDGITYKLKSKLNSGLIDKQYRLTRFSERLPSVIKTTIEAQKLYFSVALKQIHHSVKRMMKGKIQEIDNLQNMLPLQFERTLSSQKRKLEYLEKSNKLFDPDQILKKGFSITRSNNKVVKNREMVQVGDVLTTILYKGEIKSVVEDKGERNH